MMRRPIAIKVMSHSEMRGGSTKGKKGKIRLRPGLFAFFALFALFASSLHSFESSSHCACGPTAGAIAASQDQFSIRWAPDPAGPGRVAVEVYGLSAAEIKQLRKSKRTLAEWQRLFSVYAGQEDSNDASTLPPMLGVYRVESNALRFEPKFPLEPGLTYRAVFHADQLPGGSKMAAVKSFFQTPRRSATP